MPYMIGTPEGHSLCHGPRADVSCLPHLSQHGHLAPEEIKARDGGLCNATSRIYSRYCVAPDGIMSSARHSPEAA
jgi:hypothetical protein